MITYKMEILPALRAAGYSQNRLRVERLMGQATLTQLRHGELVSWKNVDIICDLLDCQPGDILAFQRETPAGAVRPGGGANNPSE